MCIAKKMIVLTIGLAASSHHAQAAPMFTLSSFGFEVSRGETLKGVMAASSPVAVAAFNSVSKSTPIYTTVITLAPTTTTAGIATTYEKYTATTTHTAASHTDTANYRVDNATAATTRDFQYIRLTGLITAQVATTLTYQLIAAGAYTPVSDERHGVTMPRDLAMWFHTGSTLAAVSNTKTDSHLDSNKISAANDYVQSSNLPSKSIVMAAGQQLYVAAEVDTATNVSLSNFVINFTSNVYGGEVSDPTSATVNRVAFTSVIAPIAEPATPAMFLAGLGLIGVLIRRKKTPA